MEVCACTHESNLSKNGNMHSKEEKKKKKTVLVVHRRWGFVDEQGCKLISFCYQTISLKTLFIHVFTINLSSHSHCVDDCLIINVEQM